MNTDQTIDYAAYLDAIGYDGKSFNPDQARGSDGKWTSGGDSAPASKPKRPAPGQMAAGGAEPPPQRRGGRKPLPPSKGEVEDRMTRAFNKQSLPSDVKDSMTDPTDDQETAGRAGQYGQWIADTAKARNAGQADPQLPQFAPDAGTQDAADWKAASETHIQEAQKLLQEGADPKDIENTTGDYHTNDILGGPPDANQDDDQTAADSDFSGAGGDTGAPPAQQAAGAGQPGGGQGGGGKGPAQAKGRRKPPQRRPPGPARAGKQPPPQQRRQPGPAMARRTSRPRPPKNFKSIEDDFDEYLIRLSQS